MKKLFIVLAVAFSTVSCSEESIEVNDESINRLEFIQNKSELDIKNEYLGLTFQEQKSLWINKFEQASNTALPNEHLNLIEEITEELSKVSSEEELYANSIIRDNFIKIAEITPKKELTKIFMSLGNYAPEKASFASVEKCLDCGEKASQQWSSYKPKQIASENSTEAVAQVSECNCDWTCDDDEGDADLGLCVTGDCEDTASGCGLLWLGKCESKNIPCPAP